jgi:hypothetical protein
VADTLKDERYRAYWEAIRRRVCASCLDQHDDETCGLSGHRVCAIETHLPRIVQTILSVESDRMDDYVAAIEREVCTRCPSQDPSGHCALREGGDCGLYQYMFLVVEAIEEVRGSARDGRSV